MSCTRIILLLLVALTGCAGTSTHHPPQAPALANGATAETADKEITLFQQAITSLNNAELEKAESDFKALTKSRPGLAGPWLNLALIDIKKKDMASAEKNLAVALERNPSMPQAYNMLGFIETSKGSMTKAVAHYQKAISLKSDYAIAHYNLALMHDIYLHDNATAVTHYKRYLELTNNQDKRTADWVAELERGLARGSQ